MNTSAIYVYVRLLCITRTHIKTDSAAGSVGVIEWRWWSWIIKNAAEPVNLNILLIQRAMLLIIHFHRLLLLVNSVLPI